ncbi:MAG: polymorphic toxin-type HINT domain-containing protein, partial [Candidatus Micrarchaeia archaeon]
MRERLRFLIIILLLSSLAFGRGGGGCLLPYTLILTPSGEKPVISVSPGDYVISFSNGRAVSAKVVAVYETVAEEYFEVKTRKTAVNVTGEHPFLTKGGEFKEVEHLEVGDRVFVISDGELGEDEVVSVTLHRQPAKAYNLLVEKGDFFANSILLHNKGCFLPDTPILTADGVLVNVSAVKKGDKLIAFTYDGKVLNTTVEEVYTATADGYYVIRTEGYEVRVTGEHPFYTGGGVFKNAESLRVGDVVYVFNGTELSKERVVFKEFVERDVTVYNLRTEWPNTYFANFIAVHNKGGCFLPGTQIETPSGKRSIEELKGEDTVLAFDSNGGIAPAKVLRVTEMDERGFYKIKTESYEVEVTPEHPLLSENGVFVKAADLREGDVVYVLKDGELKAERIEKKKFFDENVKVFNLNVDGLHTFFANNFAVHNKGGCFAAGTRILTPNGERSIETIRKGDVVFAVDEKSRVSQAEVIEVFRTKSRILQVRTTERAVNTTAEHPFLIDGEFKEASQLSVGDKVTVFDGGIHYEVVVSLEYLGEETVYNLHVGEPFSFVANGFVVHNKGGSFGGGSGSSYNPYTEATYCGKTKSLTLKNGSALTGSECFYVYYAKANSAEATRLESCVKGTDSVWSSCEQFTGFAIRKERQFRCAAPEPCMGVTSVVLPDGTSVKVTRPKTLWEWIVDLVTALIILGMLGLFILSFLIFGGVVGAVGLAAKASAENLDYCYPSSQIDRKAERTAKLLNYLKGIDKQWDPELLKSTARETFLKLQECWERREYSEMQPLLMPDLYAQHLE